MKLAAITLPALLLALSSCSGGAGTGAAVNASSEVSCPGCAVTTLAGSGQIGTADGGPTTAQFNDPAALAVDSGGTLYVADTDNHRIRKVNAGGNVSTLAGGDRGFADGTGTAALFKEPRGIAVDGQGNVYVADNNRIRKVTAQGLVTTFVGGAAGLVDGSGSAARFSIPEGLAFDGLGNLYVADSGNQRIRKVTPDGTVSTVAGSGAPDSVGLVAGGFADGPALSARFFAPAAVAVDATGAIIVADAINQRIRRIAGGAVTTLAGSSDNAAPGIEGKFLDAPGTVAQFNAPTGLAANGTDIYVADSGNQRIRKVDAGGNVTTLGGSGHTGINVGGFADGAGPVARFNVPQGVAFSDGKIYVADSFNQRIRVLTQGTLRRG